MSGVHLVLIATGLIGMLPLVVILVKRKRFLHLINSGMPAKARVFDKKRMRKQNYEIVWYTYYGRNGEQYSNSVTTSVGKYRRNDVIDIKVDPVDGKKSAVPGPPYSFWIISFGVLIAVIVWYFVYKLFGMVEGMDIKLARLCESCS